MKNRPDFKTFKNKALKDKNFKAEYESLRPEFELMEKFIEARKKSKVSQMELAKRLNLQQPAIARLEGGGYSNTSIHNLNNCAKALGYSLKILLVPKKRAS